MKKENCTDYKEKTEIKSDGIKLLDGGIIPRLGQGTWMMGEEENKKNQEIEALQLGVELGMNLIDSAEMYADGMAENLVGEAIKGIPRDELFLVSKVLPENAGKEKIFKSCEDSLRRFGVETLDLYLLHWRANVDLAETVFCLEKLVSDGKILRWGVSNFDTADMEDLWCVPDGQKCVVNQILYHLGSRGIEYDLLPWMEQRAIPAMAYCPIAQGGNLRNELISNPTVQSIAKKYKVSPVQILLSFLLYKENVIVIPKAGSQKHARENAEAIEIKLSEADFQHISREFPAPKRKTPLEKI